MIKFLQRCLALLAMVGESLSANADQSGSGFCISPKGYFLTNHHVIADAAHVIVAIPDIAPLPAVIVKDDPKKDLALLWVDVRWMTSEPTSYLPIGKSENVSELDHIVVAGYPLPETLGFELSMYEGTVNAVRPTKAVSLLQIDANVNLGNSGGPVLNQRGQVVGVVESKLDALKFAINTGTFPERVNFAISIDDARSLLDGIDLGFKVAPGDLLDDLSPSSALTSKDLYNAAKNAVVLIYSQTDEQTQIPLSSKDSIPPTKEEVRALVERELRARNARDDDQAISCYASLTSYYNMGWVHPDAIRLWLFIDRSQNPFQFEQFVGMEGIENGRAKPNGQPKWKVFFKENIVQGKTRADAEVFPVTRRTIVIRENGALRFEEWQ